VREKELWRGKGGNEEGEGVKGRRTYQLNRLCGLGDALESVLL